VISKTVKQVSGSSGPRPGSCCPLDTRLLMGGNLGERIGEMGAMKSRKSIRTRGPVPDTVDITSFVGQGFTPWHHRDPGGNLRSSVGTGNGNGNGNGLGLGPQDFIAP